MDEEEDIRCPFCDSIVEKTTVLPCSHEVCELCVRALPDQACPTTMFCKAQPLVNEGETSEQALERKRAEAEQAESRLSAAEIRAGLALDKIKEAHDDKVAKAEKEFIALAESFARAALGIEKDAIKSTSSSWSARACEDAASGYSRDDPIVPRPMKFDLLGQVVILPRVDPSMFASQMTMYQYFVPYTSKAQKASIEANCATFSSRKHARTAIDYAPKKWDKIIDAPYDVYVNDQCYYAVKADIVFRQVWGEDKIAFQKRVFVSEDGSILTRDWIVKPQCRITNDVLGTTATLSGPFFRVAGLGGRHWAFTHPSDWTIERATVNTTTRDRKLRNAAALLAKKETKIRSEFAVEQQGLINELKCLECEIDTLGNLTSDAPVAKRATTPKTKIQFAYDKKALVVFEKAQAAVKPGGSEGRYRPCSSALRSNTLVVPITENRALVISDHGSALVEVRGDLLEDKAKPGRLSFILTHHKVSWAIAIDRVLWIQYYGSLRSDRTVKTKGFSLVDIGQKVAGKPPKLVFGQVPGAVKAKYGLDDKPGKGMNVIANYFVAEYSKIRTRVWYVRTRGNHVCALGSITY